MTALNGVHDAPPRGKVIQKFGGTSVGKFPIDIVNVVKSSLVDNDVAIVCSARSSSTKAAGTTNRLLRAASDAENHYSKSFHTLIDAVRADHIETAEKEIKTPELQARLKQEVNDECDLVIRILEAAQTLGETSPRSRDKVMSVGEKLSCRFMTALLEEHGVPAQYVDFADIIDFKVEHSLNQDFYDSVAANMAKFLPASSEIVPVITGYFGAIPRGLLTTVGRGYTDLCAALVAVGTHAQELQIWKEVDGIFTADPRKVPTAQLIPQISPAEAAELTFYGSEVIHPSTMDQVIRARIPIRIKNVMNPRGRGTVIYPDSAHELEPTLQNGASPLFRSRSSTLVNGLTGKRPKRPTAVTMKHQILVVNVHSNKRSLSHGFFAGIFATLDKWRLSVDVISTSEVNISMALHSEAPLYTGGGDDEYKIVDQDLQGAINDLRSFGAVDIIPDMAIVSLVGKQMKNMVGVAGRMFSTLGENNVNIEMISQGEPFSPNYDYQN
ncbi:hypothetical protein LTS08_006268 [Lithohypha guttulata]|nr:hypothetical protein LTS08_006268 [Lithohypha guttulata]